MIKKITTEQLVTGMYIHDLACSWLTHPFVVNQFTIKSDEQIQKIIKAGISELFIDTDKGLDVGEKLQLPIEEIESAHLETSEAGGTQAKDSPPAKPRVALQAELKRAATVQQETCQAIRNIMEEARSGNHIDTEVLTPLVDSMVASVAANPNALLGLTRVRDMDQFTYQHSVGVSVLLTAIGTHLGMPNEDIIQMGIGGLLHDIGKSKLTHEVLYQGKTISPIQKKLRQKHITFNQEILADIPDISEIARSIVLEHHERYDGSGYPDQKKGEAISLYGQLAGIADYYDALTTDRDEYKAISPNDAMRRLMSDAKNEQHFNPELVQIFIHYIGIYPVGSLVTLSNGQFAVTIETHEEELLKPKIRIIFDSIKRSFIEPQDIDLATALGNSLKIVGVADPAKWKIEPLDYMDLPGTA